MRFRFYKSPDFKELIALLKINGSFDKATDSKRIFSKLIRQNPKSIILAVEGKQNCRVCFCNFHPV
ncbi:MAG: hypothetical protein Q7R70_06370 [Candidatus Diapherotrites archaeon]|nr:hypothetical protein [Candidatus Diapherotrites archaeon]